MAASSRKQASPRKKARSRKKIILAVAVILALAVFLPPNINGARFSKRLASTLSAALGRQVKIGSVKFRLLPRPGFDLYDFEVLDDPAFSAEPLLLCGQVTADLRLTSLWRGRLEIANLKLQNTADRTPPSLNLVYANGHWNVESLLIRAEQIPSAPTSKKSSEQRARFPYIEADAGRINIKIGPEKKPYALTNTDFAFWLAAEDHWHVRLDGHPVRTDMNLSDTGTVKLEGDLRRSPDLRGMPVKLQLTWQQMQLGQLSSLVLGHDKGWRGDLDLALQLEGTPADLHVTAEADLHDFRRYDITQGETLELNTRCQGQYDLKLLNFDCNTPVEGGGLRLSGRFTPLEPHNYDLSLVVNRVPVAALATFARHAKRALPDDLTATGQVDAAFSFHAHAGSPEDWHGSGLASAFVLQSSLASTPIQVSAIRFHLGIPEAKAPVVSGKRARAPAKKPVQNSQPRLLVLDPFLIQLDTTSSLEAQGTLGSKDYSLALKGKVPLDRFLELGRISGFPSRIVDTTGVADVDLAVSGLWANFTPAKLIGTAHLQDVTAMVPGIRNHLLLSTADVQFTDVAVVVGHIAAELEHSPVSLAGSVSKPLVCQSEIRCDFQFDLRANTLATSDITALLGFDQTAWKLPFFSSGPAKLPEFRATGTLSLGILNIAELPIEKFIAHLEFGDNALVVSDINGKIAGGGSLDGNWRIDWSASPTRYSGTGTFTGISPEHLGLPASAESLLAAWINGKTNLKYSLNLSGASGTEMLASATGQAEFLVVNGISRALAIGSSKPLSFLSLQGKLEIDHELLNVLPSKLKAENRIYDLNGTISLADRQAKLKISSNASRWEVTGALDKPVIAAQPFTAKEISTHSP